MAPEVLRRVDAFKEDTTVDENEVDNKAVDMWALGEIVHRMLTGEPTFPSPLMMLRHVDSARPLPLNGLKSPQIPDSAKHFVKCLMKADPRDRMTAQQALRHKWMKVYESLVSEILGNSTLK